MSRPLPLSQENTNQSSSGQMSSNQPMGSSSQTSSGMMSSQSSTSSSYQQGGNVPITSTTHVRAEEAQAPVKEYREFIEQPNIQKPTEYVKTVQEQHRQEGPVRVVQQPIQQVHEKTVVQEQPVVTNKQVLQVQKEAPIEVRKHTTETQQLPTIERKEMEVQVIEGNQKPSQTIQKEFIEGGKPTPYQVTAPEPDARQISQMQSDTQHRSVVEKIKETVGGTKEAAHGVIEKAREKAHEIFHPGASTSSSRETPST